LSPQGGRNGSRGQVTPAGERIKRFHAALRERAEAGAQVALIRARQALHRIGLLSAITIVRRSFHELAVGLSGRPVIPEAQVPFPGARGPAEALTNRRAWLIITHAFGEGVARDGHARACVASA